MQQKFITSIKIFTLLALVAMLTSSCQEFIFGKVEINYEEDPRIVVKMPTTKADIYFKEPPVVTTPNLQNPDKDGAFADWATCLVMIKEGHSHGGGKLHGNYVYQKSPWKQEEFIVIHNTPDGPVLEVDKKSTVTYLEEERGMEGPNYLRVTAGPKTLWGMTFYFYDKEGKLMNDRILEDSNHYQIFFSPSELDDKGKPYTIQTCRWFGVGEHNPSAKKDAWHEKPREEWTIAYPEQDLHPSTYFADKMTFKQLQDETHQLFKYTYRDTWRHEAMNDGVRDFFNIKLLPPLTRSESHLADDADVDRVGLKGHFIFDFPGWEGIEGITWPEPMSTKKNMRPYTRKAYLLPQFYIAVRVMKKLDGNKLVMPIPEGMHTGRESKMMCPHYTGPEDETGWVELMRFNIPVRVFGSLYDTDPTSPDPYQPYYWQLAMELKLTPQEVYESANNRIIHSNDGLGGEGFGQWFL